MKCDFSHFEYIENALNNTHIITSGDGRDQIDTRSLHNIHISFRLPSDVNLGSSYLPTLVGDINAILTTTYNPLPGEDYYISGYDVKKLPPSYYISWLGGNLDLTLAGNPNEMDML